MVTNDQSLVRGITEAFEGLYSATPRSIFGEAVARNERGEIANDEIGDQYEGTERQARGKRTTKRR